jgi:ABC-type methionine transport system ATPase subunit
VLVLDEATSALDPKTESAVVDALRPIMAGWAVLIVAHRFSTVRHADRVVVLRDGRLGQAPQLSGLEVAARTSPVSIFRPGARTCAGLWVPLALARRCGARDPP